MSPGRVGPMPFTRLRTRAAWQAGALVAAIVAVATPPTPSASAATSTLPRQIRATLLVDPTGPGYPTPLPYGTPVTRENGRIVTGAAFLGDVAWAVEWDGPAGRISQYPIRSSDHGATWTTAGSYLATSGAAGANVTAVKVFSWRIVIAYSLGANVLDVTWDAGRHWYKAWMPGNILSVSALHGVPTPAGSPASMRVTLRTLGHRAVTRTYSSRTSGRVWRLGGRWALATGRASQRGEPATPVSPAPARGPIRHPEGRVR